MAVQADPWPASGVRAGPRRDHVGVAGRQEVVVVQIAPGAGERTGARRTGADVDDEDNFLVGHREVRTEGRVPVCVGPARAGLRQFPGRGLVSQRDPVDPEHGRARARRLAHRGGRDRDGMVGPELVVAQKASQRIELVAARHLLARDVLRHRDRDPGCGRGGLDAGVHREAGCREPEHDDGPDCELDPRRAPGVADKAQRPRGAHAAPPPMRQTHHCATRTSRSFLATAATTIPAAFDASGHVLVSVSEPESALAASVTGNQSA